MIPRNEHPNPNFKRNDYIILNGEWDFEFDFGNSKKAEDIIKCACESYEIGTQTIEEYLS